MGEETVSPDVRSDVYDRIGGLYFCIVGGMFVACLTNVVIAIFRRVGENHRDHVSGV